MKININNKGELYSIELILMIIILIIIISTITNLIDKSNEKINSKIEISDLEKLNNEICDNLIKNPGTPENWENLTDKSNVICGLAVKNENKTRINTVSYDKILCLKANYNTLIKNKLFNNKIKSQISIYPINLNIKPIITGDTINNPKNIFIINRTIKCDYLSKYSVFNIEIEKDDRYIFNNNEKEEVYIENNTYWIYKTFIVNNEKLNTNNYYLIFPENNTKINNYYSLDNGINQTKENIITKNSININSEIKELLNNNENKTISIHFKLDKKQNNFKCILICIPNTIDSDYLIYDYFKTQECYFILKTWY